jgi:hypothetical protein
MPAPTIQNPTPGPITGAATWRKVRSAPNLSGGKVRIHETWKGAYSELTTAYNYLVSNSPWPESVSPSVPDNSAIATLTKIYVYSQPWFTQKPHEVQTPQYECLGVRMNLELRTFEPFAADILDGNGDNYETIDELMQSGQGAIAVANFTVDPAKAYAALRIKGVTHFERVTYNLRITRTFDTRENVPDLFNDYSNVGKIAVSWSDLTFLGDHMPSFITPPLINIAQDTSGTMEAENLEWKYCEPRVEYRGKGVSVILGADGDYQWSRALYGGTLDP